MSPATANAWSAEEVARRWVKLYPTGKNETDQLKIEAILANDGRRDGGHPPLADATADTHPRSDES